MDQEKMEAMSKIVSGLKINLDSKDAKVVAKDYLWLKFVDDQITNVIWAPLALALAAAFYAASRWILGQI